MMISVFISHFCFKNIKVENCTFNFYSKPISRVEICSRIRKSKIHYQMNLCSKSVPRNKRIKKQRNIMVIMRVLKLRKRFKPKVLFIGTPQDLGQRLCPFVFQQVQTKSKDTPNQDLLQSNHKIFQNPFFVSSSKVSPHCPLR